MPLQDYTSLGINGFLESGTSSLTGFRELQFYNTMSLDSEGSPISQSISEGISTLKTNKLSQAEINEMLGKIRVNQLSGGDVSQPINVISGWIQSANFVSGSTGWRIDNDGNLEASSGTFRGTVSAATITSSTITGGSIEIIGSGTTWFAVTTSGIANLRTALVCSSWIQLNTSLGISLKGISGTSTFPSELDLQNNSTMDDVVIYASRLKTNPTTNLAEFYGKGGTKDIILIDWASTATNSSGNALKINYNGDSNKATGHSLHINHGSNTTDVAPLQIDNAAVISTNFSILLGLGNPGGAGTRTIYLSNGTTPNGNLSGTRGDLCLNGTLGQPFYCSTTGTTWTGL